MNTIKKNVNNFNLNFLAYLEKGGYVMYYNISSLLDVNSNVDVETYKNQISREENKTTIEKKKILFENLFSEFKNFLSNKASLIIIDFQLNNYELKFLTSVLIEIYSINEGYDYQISIKTLKYEYYTSIDQLIRLVIEIIFVILTIFLSIKICIIDYFACKNIFIYEQFKIFDDRIIKTNTNDMGNKTIDLDFSCKRQSTIDYKEKHKLIMKKKLIKLTNSKLSLFTIFNQIYFSNFLQFLNLISLFLSFACIVLWCDYCLYLFQNSANLKYSFDNYNIVLNFNFSNQLIFGVISIDRYIKLISFTSIFIFLRLIKVFESPFKNINSYILRFRKALYDTFAFFLLFVLLLFSFSIILYFSYSNKMQIFNSFQNSFIKNLYFCVGNPDTFIMNEMYKLNGVSTIIYFLTMILIMKFTYSRIILAIILYHFENLRFLKSDKYKKQSFQSFLDTLKREKIFSVFKNFQFYLKRIQLCLKCKKKSMLFKKKKKHQIEILNSLPFNNERKKNLMKIENQMNENFPESILKRDDFKKSTSIDYSNENKISHKNIPNLKEGNNNRTRSHSKFIKNNSFLNKANYDLNTKDLEFIHCKYVENFEIISRDPYFDSSNDVDKLKSFYEKKYENNFRLNILYMIFFVFLLFSIVFNTLSPLKYKFNKILHYSFLNSGINDINSIGNNF